MKKKKENVIKKAIRKKKIHLWPCKHTLSAHTMNKSSHQCVSNHAVKGQLCLLCHSSAGRKFRCVHLSSVLRISQGQGQVKVWGGLGFYPEAPGGVLLPRSFGALAGLHPLRLSAEARVPSGCWPGCVLGFPRPLAGPAGGPPPQLWGTPRIKSVPSFESL